MGGGVGSNGKLTKPLTSLVNRNEIFEYNTQLAPIDDPSMEKNVNSQSLVSQQRILSDAAEKSKMGVGCSVWYLGIHTIWNK